MATRSDIDNTLLSGHNHIDALLDIGPDWNYLTPVGNTIYYTFSVSSDNEVRDKVPVTGQQAFTVSQQANARLAMQYISELTGIVFTETANGAAAQVHLCNLDLDPSTTGECSWLARIGENPETNALVSYDVDAYIYLDNVDFGSRNANLAQGGEGYETLLHELGHMLGLQHPFDQEIKLPDSQNNTSYTLMAYNDAGGPYATFNSFDIAALNWIYGGDGLRGALGINSDSGARYLTGNFDENTLVGTPFNDTLKGDGGKDVLNGGGGSDTAIFSGTRTSYAFAENADGTLTVSGADGLDTLTSIEFLQFSDGSFQRSEVVDSTPPAAPKANVTTNAANYASGSTPAIFGTAEANSTIKVFNGIAEIARGTVNANGVFNIATVALANGSYTVTATATDAAGNASAAVTLSFLIDATPPSTPTASVSTGSGGVVVGNQPAFAGTGEAGSTITLLNTGSEVIGRTTVGAGGSWSIAANPLPNGSYNVDVQSSDAADNRVSASAPMTFSIDSTLNRSGSAANDTLTGTAGNNALQGLDGIDLALYAGARAAYTVTKSSNGFTVSSSADGLDSLIGVERVKFSDASLALDIDGFGGQAYRLYSAAFNRTPDLAGVGYWIDDLDRGAHTLQQVAGLFMADSEFKTQYGANVSTAVFVNNLYLNVLKRPLDQPGYDYWVDVIDRIGVGRDVVLMQFSESIENQAQVIGTIENGFAYIPWAG
jgi:serralysin